MSQEKQISTNELARMIKQGFDGVTIKINSVAKQIRKVQKGLDDLTVICKEGFDGTPSRKEFEEFRRLVLHREEIIAQKLGLDLSKIDAEV